MDLTPENIRALRTTFSGVFKEGYEQTPSFWAKIAMTAPSTSQQNDYGWMADLPQVREWLGPRVIHNLGAHSYTLKNKTWELSVGVRREDFEDDNLGVYQPLFRSQGEAFAKHPDELFVQLLEQGHTSAVTSFDGQSFFDVDHPVAPLDTGSATYSNYRTSFALNQANFLTARSGMAKIKGDGGRIVGRRPNLLVVPPALEAMAISIVKNERDAAGASNTSMGMCDYLVIDELTSDTAWYLLCTDRTIKPFVFQQRRPVSLVAKNGNLDEVVIEDNQYRFYGDARYAAGVTLPFLALKATA